MPAGPLVTEFPIRNVVISELSDVGGQEVVCSIGITSYQAGSSGVRSLGKRFRLRARSGSPIEGLTRVAHI